MREKDNKINHQNSFWLTAMVGVLLVGLGVFLYSTLEKASSQNPAAVETSKGEKEEKNPVPRELKMLAVGDIMLARKVGSLMNSRGVDYPFLKVEERLNGADITFGNLECAISKRGVPLPGKGIWFRASPEVTGKLKDSGFDILSIANNHAYDYDTYAFLDTMEYLRQEGIRHVGGGANLDFARDPVIMEVGDMGIGFLSYTEMADIFWSYQKPVMFQADTAEPGVAPYDVELILEDIKELRERVDTVVLSLHWGVEYSHRPTDKQRSEAYQFIDAGADLIIGHHPHVVQGLEVYNQGIIAYSLGNFIFDQNWSQATREGLMLGIRLNKLGIIDARLYPLIINDSQPNFQENQETKNLASKVRDFSRELGTELNLSQSPLYLSIPNLNIVNNNDG